MNVPDHPDFVRSLASSLNRRSFLKLGAFGSALSLASSSADHAAGAPPLSQVEQEFGRGREPLPAIPKPSDLASDQLVHHFRDYFNPPQAQNELGSMASHKSVSAITAIAFPPFGCCGVPEIAFSPGNLVTCELFLNDQILTDYPAPAGRVAYIWYPYKILRETRVVGLLFQTEAFLPSHERIVAESIVVKNESGERRKLTLGFDLRAGVTATSGKPWFVNTPAETDNHVTPNESNGCVIFEAQHSRAVSVQGISPRPDRIVQKRMLVYEFSLGPGESRSLHYLNVIDEAADAALETYKRRQAGFDELQQENERAAASLLQAAFTPGNSEFSGHLPQLHTHNPALWKLFYNGIAGLLFCRRVSPNSVYGPTYVTIGRVIPTLSFIWDTMLTSLSLSLLDPKALRSLIEVWLIRDMHQHLATDYLTGQGVGPWYAVNDMGILRCADNYLRVTGNFDWLDKELEEKPVIEHLVDHALYWKKLVKSSTGLADYGEIQNLLEVVSTWIHEVPAMNAGNVYGMRFVAALLDRRGDRSRASQLRTEARELAERINRLLYVKGKGWWRCGQPDGTFNEVRHCYDLLTVLDTMFEDLSDEQKKEMSHFFWSQLHTPLWMHALSPGDPDATWNVRADHSWLGAYAAWPSMTAKGLYKTDPSGRVAEWVKGLARSGNQGPYAQAHIVENIFTPEQGGAMKSPLDQPYGNDWAIVSGGSFADLVIDSIFGADLGLDHGIRVSSRLMDFDSEAQLRNVNYQGQGYTITCEGAQRT
jgi:hypothetical protein